MLYLHHPDALYDLAPDAVRRVMEWVDARYQQDKSWWSLAPMSTLDLLRLLNCLHVPHFIAGIMARFKIKPPPQAAEPASVDDRTAALLMERLRG